jgi:hypothetical protein
MKRILAALGSTTALLTALVLSAAPAHAATWVGPVWNDNQPTITVSDRNGYDLNENEAAYAWGSLSADDMTMAYTQYETCTYCIKVYTGSVGPNSSDLYSAIVTTEYHNNVLGFNKQWAIICNITVDVTKVGTYWKARQAVMTHAIGHCLGLGNDTAGQSIMNHYNLTHPDNAYTPGANDYDVIDVHYSGTPWLGN